MAPSLDELYSLFKERAEALAAKVFRAPSVADVPAIVSAIISGASVRRVVGVRSPMTAAAGLESALASQEFEISLDDILDRVADADVGISEFDLAIAETGTLVQNAEALGKRLVSTLPPVLIALVPTVGLVRNMAEAFEALEERFGGSPPGFLAFVSGPSRTADIERVLTIGVHGPGQLFIILVDGGGEKG